jgi:hypothetical protein
LLGRRCPRSHDMTTFGPSLTRRPVSVTATIAVESARSRSLA